MSHAPTSPARPSPHPPTAREHLTPAPSLPPPTATPPGPTTAGIHGPAALPPLPPPLAPHPERPHPHEPRLFDVEPGIPAPRPASPPHAGLPPRAYREAHRALEKAKASDESEVSEGQKAALWMAISAVVSFVGVLMPWFTTRQDFSRRGWNFEDALPTSYSGLDADYHGAWVLVLTLVGGAAAGMVHFGKERSLPLKGKPLAQGLLGVYALAAFLTFVDWVWNSPYVDSGRVGGRSLGIYVTLGATFAGFRFARTFLRLTPEGGPYAPPKSPSR